LDGSRCVKPTLQEWEVMLTFLRAEHLHNWFEIILQEKILFPTFLNLLNHLYQHELMDIYLCLSYNPLQLSLFCFSDFFPDLLSFLFTFDTPISGYLCAYLLTHLLEIHHFLALQESRVNLYISCPGLSVLIAITFPKSPYSFLGNNTMLQSKIWSLGKHVSIRLSFFFWLSWRQNKEIHMHILIFT
jgi:hypothetical protein